MLDAPTPTCVAEGNLAQRTPCRRIRPAHRRVVAFPGDAGIVDARTHWIPLVDAPATACVLEAVLIGGAVEDHAAALVGIVISVVNTWARGSGHRSPEVPASSPPPPSLAAGGTLPLPPHAARKRTHPRNASRTSRPLAARADDVTSCEESNLHPSMAIAERLQRAIAQHRYPSG